MAIRSTPPATSASACSAKTSRSSSTVASPIGGSMRPDGPMSPATSLPGATSSRAAVARRAPAVFNSATRSPAW